MCPKNIGRWTWLSLKVFYCFIFNCGSSPCNHLYPLNIFKWKIKLCRIIKFFCLWKWNNFNCSNVNWITTLICCSSETFFLMLAHRNQSGGFYSWVYGVGSEEEMKKFDFTVKFFNPISREEIAHRGPVLSIEKKVRNIVEEEPGLFFRDMRCKRLMNNPQLGFDVEIIEHQ